MRSLAIIGILTVMLMICPVVSYSEWIVDTGEPSGGPEHWPGDPDWMLPGFHHMEFSEGGSYSWYAGQFTLDQSYQISSIEGYLCNKCLGGGGVESEIMRFSIYEGEAYPNSKGLRIFEESFFSSQEDGGWGGIFDLNFKLDTGIYWLAFEPNVGPRFLSSLRYDVPNPLDKYAQLHKYLGYSSSGDNYYDNFEVDPALGFNFGWGLRIEGDPVDLHVVPAPTSLLLFGTGGTVFCIAARLKRRYT